MDEWFLTGVTMSDLNQKIFPCFRTNHLQSQACQVVVHSSSLDQFSALDFMQCMGYELATNLRRQVFIYSPAAVR